MEARLFSPLSGPCEGGDNEHTSVPRTFIAYEDDGTSLGDRLIATWCDECAEHAEASGQFIRVCPLIRIDEHSIGVWQAYDGWWGAPLVFSDMPDLNAEFYIPDEKAELLPFLEGMEALS